MFVGGVVGSNHVREPFDSSNRFIPQPLVVEVVFSDDEGSLGWIARGEHRHHRLENLRR
jgi:hypothetical protein